MPSFRIQPLASPSSAEFEAVRVLVPQLSPEAPPLTHEDLAAMVAAPSTTVFTAVVEGRIVGMTTLIVFRATTGLRANIDDVVVDRQHRGRGIGEALVRAAVEHARTLGVRRLDLTSRPARQAANRLYQRLGFKIRETNAYGLRLTGLPAGGQDS